MRHFILFFSFFSFLSFLSPFVSSQPPTTPLLTPFESIQQLGASCIYSSSSYGCVTRFNSLSYSASIFPSSPPSPPNPSLSLSSPIYSTVPHSYYLNVSTSWGPCRGHDPLFHPGYERYCAAPGSMITIKLLLINNGVLPWLPSRNNNNNNDNVIVKLSETEMKKDYLTMGKSRSLKSINRRTLTIIEQSMQLSGGSDDNWSLRLKNASAVGVGQTGLFEGRWMIPKGEGIIGVHNTYWQLHTPCGGAGPIIPIQIEITCSDQVFCNGAEQWINGQCVSPGSASPPCNDNQSCTTDHCDEEHSLCSYSIPNPSSCPTCTGGTQCVPRCPVGAQCGSDGCGGLCGSCIGTLGQACHQHQCMKADYKGSCINPIQLIENNQRGLLGPPHQLSLDLNKGGDEVTLSCFPDGTAPDQIIKFRVPPGYQTLYIDARVAALSNNTVDTLLELRSNYCRDQTLLYISDPLQNNKTEQKIETPTILQCNDAASPPGNFGSRILYGPLAPGDYYLVVSSYPGYAYNLSSLSDSILQSKDYSDLPIASHIELTVFFKEYEPRCDEKYCGDDGGGGDCGVCKENEICTGDFICRKKTSAEMGSGGGVGTVGGGGGVCVPNCEGRECGDDGCGGETCGKCNIDNSEYCIVKEKNHHNNTNSIGTSTLLNQDNNNINNIISKQSMKAYCQPFPACNSLQPVCLEGSFISNNNPSPVPMPGCPSNHYCASDCRCRPLSSPLPDLVISEPMLTYQIGTEVREFGNNSCAIVENCITKPGPRKLLRFNAAIINQGFQDLSMPPPLTRPDLYGYSPCHKHYHFEDFSEYALIGKKNTIDDNNDNNDNNINPNQMEIIAKGHKQSFCLEDTYQALQSPSFSCGRKYICDTPGIQAGWADLYGRALDCQWVDITDLPAGQYWLRVEVNQLHKLVESNYDNNVVIIPIILPQT